VRTAEVIHQTPRETGIILTGFEPYVTPNMPTTECPSDISIGDGSDISIGDLHPITA